MRRAAVVVTLAALVLAAAGCGKSGTNASSTTGSFAPSVQAAVEKTLKSGSEHMTLTAKVNAGGQAVALTGKGDFDLKKQVGSMHAGLTVSGLQVALDEVQSGTAIYVGSSFFSSFLPAGKKWLKIDLADAAKQLGVNGSALTSADPSAVLEQVKALTGLKEVGTVTIGGIKATHFRGAVDTAKLPAAAKSAGATFGPVDVWVGDDGYVHRVRVVTNASSGGQKARTVVTANLSKFGEPVSVTVPKDSETVDAGKAKIPGLSS